MDPGLARHRWRTRYLLLDLTLPPPSPQTLFSQIDTVSDGAGDGDGKGEKREGGKEKRKKKKKKKKRER